MDNTQQSNGRDPREVVTQRTYERVARKYAHTRCGKQMWTTELETFWSLLPKGARKKKILDLGCGTGVVLHHAFVSKKPLREYVGVDYSEAMQKEALAWGAKTSVPFLARFVQDLTGIGRWWSVLQRSFQRKPHVTMVTQSMQDIDPPTSYFDGVMLLASLHHLLQRSDRETMMELCFHTLKPGGVLFMTIWQKYTEEQVLQVDFTESGTKSPRYYAMLPQEEIQELLLYGGFSEIQFYDNPQNIVVSARKAILKDTNGRDDADF